MANAHPGFSAVAQDIAKREHLPAKRARAILASQSRKYAKGPAGRKNPRLRRVAGY